MIATLFVLILVATSPENQNLEGTYRPAYQEYPSKAACEAHRVNVVAAARQQPNMVLISQCGVDNEPVQMGIFFDESSVQPKNDGGTDSPRSFDPKPSI